MHHILYIHQISLFILVKLTAVVNEKSFTINPPQAISQPVGQTAKNLLIAFWY